MPRRTVACTWEKLPDGQFKVWSVADPQMSVTGPTFNEADVSLAESFFDFGVDEEPPVSVYEPVPPITAPGIPSRESGWVALASTGDRAASTAPFSALFSGGACPNCDSGLGQRSSECLEFDHGEAEQEDLCSVFQGWSSFAVISAHFIVDILNAPDLLEQFRRTRNSGNAHDSTAYLEVWSENPLRLVLPRHKESTLIQCDRCETTWVGSCSGEGMPPWFVAEPDLESVSDDWCVLFDGQRFRLAVRDSVWRRIFRNKLSRGVEALRIGSLKAEEILGKPPIRRNSYTPRP
jgi:hypothetical protein